MQDCICYCPWFMGVAFTFVQIPYLIGLTGHLISKKKKKRRGNPILFLFCLQDGVILAWKGSNENPNLFEPATSLKGHTGAVICLTVGKKRLYSGSTDNSIRVILAITSY